MNLIKKIGNDISSLLFSSGKRKGKRRYRYGVYLRGRRLSRHFTKTAARKAARKVRGARYRRFR